MAYRPPRWGSDAIGLYSKAVELSVQEAVLVTLPPDKTFVIVVDEDGNQLLMDSHLHYTDPLETFKEAVVNKVCQGLFVFTERSRAKELLAYIMYSMAPQMRIGSNTGCMHRLYASKN